MVSTVVAVRPDSCHRGVSLRAAFGEGVENFLGRWGGGVGGGVLVAGDADGDLLQGPQGADDLLDAQPGQVLQVPGDREGGEHDGQVCLDRLTLVMEHGLCRLLGYADLVGERAGR